MDTPLHSGRHSSRSHVETDTQKRLRPRTYKQKRPETFDGLEDQLGSGVKKRWPRKRPAWLQSVTHAPSYSPTEAEFEDPVAFVRRIEPEAAEYGICKITVPQKFRRHVNRFPAALRDFTFTAREQKLREHIWDKFGKTEIIYEHAQTFTVQQFRQMSGETAEKLMKGSSFMPASYVESEFWRQRNSPEASDVYVLYGNDVEGSGCDLNDPENIGSSAWNLQDLGKAPWSLLRHAPVDYPGVTTPMLYIGSLFSTFFWHVEDHWMHSINYSHYGATKTWYGIPSSHADAFEKVVLEKVYRRAIRLKKSEIEDARSVTKCALKQLLAKNTLFLPKLLIEAGIPVYRLDQEPGDFILTLPRGYHAGFSHGFNIGEAVNFALPEWLPAGKASLERYCQLGIPQILPHQLILIKEAADLLDRLKGRDTTQPSEAEMVTIQQFCSFADEHEQLRYQISNLKQLEEVPTCNPLRSQICFMCYRHIYGCFVFYTETGASRCMQCSVKAPHVTHPDWKLAVPEVVGMIDYLEHQFRTHHGVRAPDHPLEWQVPRKRRSVTRQVTRRLGKRSAEQPTECPIPKKTCTESAMRVTSHQILPMPNGLFPRTVVTDGEEMFLIAQELLVAIGAPIQRPFDVDYCLRHLLPDTETSTHEIKRFCSLPYGTMVCALIDRRTMAQIINVIQDQNMQRQIALFIEEVWRRK